MKKIFLSIIAIALIFSNSFSVSAGSFEDLFEYSYWWEEIELNLEFDSVKRYVYISQARNIFYARYLDLWQKLKIWLLEAYKAWNIEYYQMQALVKTYNNYVYYTDDLFSLLEMQEELWEYSREIEDAILRSYKKSKLYYNKINNLYY